MMTLNQDELNPFGKIIEQFIYFVKFWFMGQKRYDPIFLVINL